MFSSFRYRASREAARPVEESLSPVEDSLLPVDSLSPMFAAKKRCPNVSRYRKTRKQSDRRDCLASATSEAQESCGAALRPISALSNKFVVSFVTLSGATNLMVGVA